MKKHLLHNVVMQLCALAVAAFAFVGCDTMHDDIAECALRIKFTYDMNMKYADAFAHEVQQVTVAAYDAKTGKLSYKETVNANQMNNGCIDIVAKVVPGYYNLVVWAEGEDRCPNSYNYGSDASNSDPSALTAEVVAQDTLKHDITPLFHGKLDNVKLQRGLSTDDSKLVTVDLTKDTNVIRIVLQNTSGSELSPDEFEFSVGDDNRLLAYDNSIIKADSLTYLPWSVLSGKAAIEAVNQSMPMQRAEATTLSAVVAEFSVNRLMATHQPYLTVRRTNRDHAVLFRIPIVDYALLVKGNYNSKMDNQEYLDRQDEYNMTFFLDNDRNWISTIIYVNSWRVVLSNPDLESMD